ncbi:LytTR family DNA-binding domain-containing protein [Lachnospiraceae bacterium 50-23]|nr:LytTR family transcriptional regulator [Dorea sp.]
MIKTGAAYIELLRHLSFSQNNPALIEHCEKHVIRRPEEDPAIPVSNDTGKYKVFLRSLKYVETFNRSLLLHTESEDIICHKSMKEMEQILQDKGFVRCHTSYIVNLSYIKGVKKLEIELVTGEKIPVSQPKRKEFMEKLAACWEDLL